jgi:hypothetical protein
MNQNPLSRFALDYQSATFDGQSANCLAHFTAGAFAVRVRIHRDCSYIAQSFAVAEVWTANGWAEVVRLLPHALKTGDHAFRITGSPALGNAPALLDAGYFSQDVETLLTLTATVLKEGR